MKECNKYFITVQLLCILCFLEHCLPLSSVFATCFIRHSAAASLLGRRTCAAGSRRGYFVVGSQAAS